METLKTKDGSYDSKHILNTCTRPVPQTILDAIEDGCTIEALERAAKDFDIFKYKTQITIHGLFPNLSTHRIGEYKNLVRNKNLSVGIRYSAIDCEKRERMNRYLRLNGWRYHTSSSENYFFIEKSVNKENFDSVLNELKEKMNGIDASLFNGYASIFKIQSLWGTYLSLRVFVNSIYQKNVDACISNLCGKPMKELTIRYNDYVLKERERRRKFDEECERREIERKRIAAEREKIYAELRSKVEYPEGFIKMDNYQLKNGDIFISLSERQDEKENPVINMHFHKVFTSFGKLNQRYCDINGECTTRSGHQILNPVGTFYVKQAEQKKDAPAKVARAEPKENVVKGSYTIIDYSEKAIAVTGDTKSIKDVLKNLGGRFNPRLSCGPGWIFSKSKESAVRAAIC